MASPALAMNDSRPASKAWNIGLWVLQVVAALAFFGAAFGKLSGQPMMIGMFDKIGIGQWFRYVTGAVEVIGAILLLIPGRAYIGAALLAVTMIGAIITHLAIIGGNPTPPIVLLLITGVIAWKRWTMAHTSSIRT